MEIHQATVTNSREYLLNATLAFVDAAKSVDGVLSISLLGSLTIRKETPKDVDLLVRIAEGTDLKKLSELGRRLQGRAQSANLGADIFLANVDGKYLGRTCRFRDCHSRRACPGWICGSGSYLCDDTSEFRLQAHVLDQPPVELWPRVVVRVPVPRDVRDRLLGPLSNVGAA